MMVAGASSIILPRWDGSFILGSISRLGHSILAGRPHSTSACVGPFVRGFSPQSHPTRDRIKLCHQIQPLELQMQVPVSKTSELEILRLSGPVLCRLDGVNERATVRFNDSVSIQGVKHVVDGTNVLFSIIVHAKATGPFVLDGA